MVFLPNVDPDSRFAAMKEKNPVDHVRFFTRWDQTESFLIPKKNVSLLIPEQFSEYYIRIFVRDSSKVCLHLLSFKYLVF
jgi:hypothetical protein